MQNMILVLHLLLCVVLVGSVLMQRSEGGALGMGGGGTGGLISGRGAADMMVNITSWVGGAFFVTSVLLAVLAGARPTDRSVIPENGAAKSGFHFTIPGLPKAPATKASDFTVPVTPAPVSAAPVAGAPVGATAPAPVEAVTRAGPLSAQPVGAAPVGAAVRTPPPAASLPAAPVVGAPRTTVTPPVGTAQKKATTPATTPAAAQKTTTTAPMIPLPAATPPAPAAESEQVPVPAPPERQKAGPDE